MGKPNCPPAQSTRGKRGANQAAWVSLGACLNLSLQTHMMKTQSCSAVCAPLTACYTVAGNLKLTFPIAVAATQLAWAIITVPGAFASTPSTKAHLASLKWGTDYLLACRPSSTEFVGQVSPDLKLLRPLSAVLLHQAVVSGFSPVSVGLLLF
jgi:hypothetical protein